VNSSISIKIGNWFFKNRSFIPLLMYLFATIYLIKNQSFNNTSLKTEILFLAISLFGLLIRVLVIGFVPKSTSGRNTKKQIADSLNSKGLYSLVRHPLYIGNFFMWLGIILFIKNLTIAIIVILFFLIYYWFIIQAEENFLHNKFGTSFTEWKKNVPLFFPYKWSYKKNKVNFSLNKVLIREYSGFYAIFISFAYFNFLTEYLQKGSMIFFDFWGCCLIASSIITLTLKILKKHTTLLTTNRV